MSWTLEQLSQWYLKDWFFNPYKRNEPYSTGFAGDSINADTTEVRINIGPFNGCIEAAGQLLNNYTLLSGKRN